MDKISEAAQEVADSPSADIGGATNPDEARLNYITEMLERDNILEPSTEGGEEDDAPEVPEEESEQDEPANEEQESSGDETPDVEDDASDEDEDEVGDGDITALSFDDFKGYVLELDGKQYDGAQLKSFIGQAASVSKAQEEVTAQKAALDKRAEEQEAFNQFLQQSAVTNTERQHMQSLATAYAGLENQVEALTQSQDPERANKIADIEVQMRKLSIQYDTLVDNVQQKEAQIANAKWDKQVKFLEEKGRTDLINDEQQLRSLSEFGDSHLDPEAFEFFKSNASAMIILDMAYKSQGKEKRTVKGKLKQNKSLPTGRKVSASNVKAQQSKEVQAKARAGKLSEDEAYEARSSLIQGLLQNV